MANEIEVEYATFYMNNVPRYRAEISIDGVLVHSTEYTEDHEKVKPEVIRLLKQSAKTNRKNVEILDEQYDNLMEKIKELE